MAKIITTAEIALPIERAEDRAQWDLLSAGLRDGDIRLLDATFSEGVLRLRLENEARPEEWVGVYGSA